MKQTIQVHEDFLSEITDVGEIFLYMDNLSEVLKSDKVSDKDKLELMKEFNENAANWEIVLVRPNDYDLWALCPSIFTETEVKVGMKERVKSLVKDLFVLNPVQFKRDMQIMSNTLIPMHIIVNKENFIISENEELNTFYCKLNFILVQMAEMIEYLDSENLAIFEKPNGVRAANKLHSWIEELEDKIGGTFSNVKSTIKTSTIYDIIKEGVVDYKENQDDEEKGLIAQ